MPSKTLEDKVDELIRIVAGLVEQTRALDGRLNGLNSERAGMAKEVVAFATSLAVFEQQLKDIRTWKETVGTKDETTVDIALLRKEIEDLKKWQDEVKKQKDEWGKRLWMLLAPIVGATVGWALGYFSRPK